MKGGVQGKKYPLKKSNDHKLMNRFQMRIGQLVVFYMNLKVLVKCYFKGHSIVCVRTTEAKTRLK